MNEFLYICISIHMYTSRLILLFSFITTVTIFLHFCIFGATYIFSHIPMPMSHTYNHNWKCSTDLDSNSLFLFTGGKPLRISGSPGTAKPSMCWLKTLTKPFRCLALKRTRTMVFQPPSLQERRCVCPDSILGETCSSPCLTAQTSWPQFWDQATLPPLIASINLLTEVPTLW